MDAVRIRINCNIKPEHVVSEDAAYLYRETGVRPTFVSRIVGDMAQKNNDIVIARIDKYIDYNDSILAVLREQLNYLNGLLKDTKRGSK